MMDTHLTVAEVDLVTDALKLHEQVVQAGLKKRMTAEEADAVLELRQKLDRLRTLAQFVEQREEREVTSRELAEVSALRKGVVLGNG